jgi:hypothetical protein
MFLAKTLRRKGYAKKYREGFPFKKIALLAIPSSLLPAFFAIFFAP